jgi:precorrin-2 dehydrogenase/sirohydrochlorin ferrochelatase
VRHTEKTVYYPAFLNLKTKKAVVCGCGSVAERKIISLLNAGAVVTVISPEVTRRIEQEKQKGRIRHIRRQYKKGDLKDAFIVIAATDSLRVNKRISLDAPCLVNVVDTPLLCNFIVPSVVTRGPLTIGISTSGVSPALSRSIRKELEKLYGTEISSYMKVLRTIRAEAIKVINDPGKRGKFLKTVASNKLLAVLRKKGYKEAKKTAEGLFKKVKAANRKLTAKP